VSIFVGSWFARIPEVQTALGLSEATLGLVLLGMPVGTLVVMPLTGWLVARWGAGTVTLVAALGQGLPFLLLPVVGHALTLAIVLFGVGLVNGTLNVAMNARANAVEEGRESAIMSTCHGFFSIGGMVGAGVGSAAAAVGLPMGWQYFLLIGGGALIVGTHRSGLLAGDDGHVTGPVFAVPSSALLGLALLLFCILLAEGSVSNWSAVYLRNGLGASPGMAGLGYGAFSAAMALGRLHGDRLLERYEAGRVVQVGALLAAGGLGIGVLVGHPLSGIAGFFVQGLGFAVLVPAVYRAATQASEMAPGASIAAVASAGYIGLFTGPPLLGFVADGVGLPGAIGVVALLAAIVALGAGPVFARVGEAGRRPAERPT
jgi:MFS family permease